MCGNAAQMQRGVVSLPIVYVRTSTYCKSAKVLDRYYSMCNILYILITININIHIRTSTISTSSAVNTVRRMPVHSSRNHIHPGHAL